MPPRVVARRLFGEARAELERVLAPRRAQRAEPATSWDIVLGRPYPFVRTAVELAAITARWPDERRRVLDGAAQPSRTRWTCSGPAPCSSAIRSTGIATGRPGARGRSATAAGSRSKARPAERRQGAVGDLAGALAASGGSGVPAHRRRVVRERRTRRARRLAARESVYARRQLGDRDGAGASDPSRGRGSPTRAAAALRGQTRGSVRAFCAASTSTAILSTVTSRSPA